MTTYEQTEKKQATDRLRYLRNAINAYPEETDPMLATELLELLRLAEFADKKVHLTFRSTVGNSPIN